MLVLLLPLLVQSLHAVTRPYWPTTAWRNATPASQHMNGTLLATAAALVEYYNLACDLGKAGTYAYVCMYYVYVCMYYVDVCIM